MSDNKSSSGFAFIAGLVVGGAVGAIAGLLFAPETGEETRKKVGVKSKELAEEFQSKFDDLKDSVSEVMEDVKKGTAEVMQDVKKGTAEVMGDVKKGTVEVLDDVVRGQVPAIDGSKQHTQHLQSHVTASESNLGMLSCI